jgi:hypothetical protein
MPGASCTRSLACSKKHASVVTTSTPRHPAFPHAMVLAVYFALSPVIGLSCHRRWRLKGLAHPVGLSGHHQLDASH